MMRRGLHRALRGVCAAAVLGSPALAQPRVGGEVALSGHGGSVSGYTAPLGCGYAGIARGTLGGAGGRARILVRDEVVDGSVSGLVAVVQGGVEHRVHTSEPSGAEAAASIPEDRTLLGGSIELGYDGFRVGFRGGVLVREVIEDTSDPCVVTSESSCVRRATTASPCECFRRRRCGLGAGTGTISSSALARTIPRSCCARGRIWGSSAPSGLAPTRMAKPRRSTPPKRRPPPAFTSFYETIPDPRRVQANVAHPLLTVVFVGVPCGAEGRGPFPESVESRGGGRRAEIEGILASR